MTHISPAVAFATTAVLTSFLPCVIVSLPAQMSIPCHLLGVFTIRPDPAIFGAMFCKAPVGAMGCEPVL